MDSTTIETVRLYLTRPAVTDTLTVPDSLSTSEQAENKELAQPDKQGEVAPTASISETEKSPEGSAQSPQSKQGQSTENRPASEATNKEEQGSSSSGAATATLFSATEQISAQSQCGLSHTSLFKTPTTSPIATQ